MSKDELAKESAHRLMDLTAANARIAALDAECRERANIQADSNATIEWLQVELRNAKYLLRWTLDSLDAEREVARMAGVQAQAFARRATKAETALRHTTIWLQAARPTGFWRRLFGCSVKANKGEIQ